MKSAAHLDDTLLFLAVVRAGGLTGAAAATGVSTPTLSRRMTELEQRTGRRLFVRGPGGFALTAEGRSLLEVAAPLEEQQSRLHRWIAEGTGPHPVRITAGSWTARFIARHIAQVWSPRAAWVPTLLGANARLDIARRAADIGIRSSRPEQNWLAGRRTRRVSYGIFARDADVTGFIALPADAPSTPAERWLRATHPDRIVTTANHERLALDLARAGVGALVMPVFAGADGTGLVQQGPAIDALAHDEWLVSHHTGRDDPPVRAALDALARLLTAPRPGD